MDIISNRQRIARWLQAVIAEIGGEATPLLVLRHITVNDRQSDVATLAPRKLEAEGGFGEFVQHLSDVIDADTDGLGGVQRYTLVAVAEDRVVARLPLRAAAPGAEGGPEPIESEPATPKGLLSQLMRHNEAQARMFAVSMGQVVATMQRTIARLQQSSDLADDRRLEAVALAEDLLSQKHERELRTQEAAADQEYRMESFKKLTGAIPIILSYLMGKGGAAYLADKLKSLMGSLSPQQWEALGKVFTPDQIEIVNELISAQNATTPPADTGSSFGAASAGAATGDASTVAAPAGAPPREAKGGRS